MEKTIDLRSDTVTRPTREMRIAMSEAVVGDDVFGDDPTVIELERLAAQLTGKESALYMVSGTMANQVALNVHTQPTDEIILGLSSHIFNYEVGGAAYHCGAQTNPIVEEAGMLPLSEIKTRFRKRDIHFPRTALICMENTHNLGGGVIQPLEHMQQVYALAREKKVRVHLDGARIFNASVESGVDVSEYCKCADSAMFCLSKGLGAPVGSMLVGSGAFIAQARRVRKSYGGGIRQAGILAAAGIVALKKMVHRLKDDHILARRFAEGLNTFDELEVDVGSVETNIVNVFFKEMAISPHTFLTVLARNDVLCVPRTERSFRMVTHCDVNDKDISSALEIIGSILKRSREGRLWN